MRALSGSSLLGTRLRKRPRTLAGALALVAVALTCLVFWRVDDYYAHGLTADWYVDHDGHRQRLMRTVEERPQFRNEHRPLERYLTHWDERKLGIPSSLPNIDSRLHGTITVPEGEARRLVLDHSGEATLFVDGAESERQPTRIESDLASPNLGNPVQRVQSEELPPGEHAIRIEWRSVMQNPGINWDRTPDVHLRLLWAVEVEVLPTVLPVIEGRSRETAEDANDAEEQADDTDDTDDTDAETPDANDLENGDDREANDGGNGVTHLTPAGLAAAVEQAAVHAGALLADEDGADEDGPDEDGADEDGADEDGADEDGADEDGADEDGADEDGADEDGADEDGADEDGADEDGADEDVMPAPTIFFETRFNDVPQSALTPVRGDGTRAWLWAFALLVALGLGGAVAWTTLAWARRSAPIAKGAGDAFQKRAFLTCALLLTLLAIPLRTYEYASAPDFRENMDELFAMWNGWQILEDGTTRGWSLWDAYYGDEITREPMPYWRRFPTNSIQPYFEHPPLFHLMAGAAVHIGGAEHYAHTKHAHGRIVSIALSVVALWLTIALGLRLAGRRAALLAGLLQATLPIIVLQSRVVKGEALIAVLMPALLLFYLKWRKSKRTRHLVFAALCAGAATLAKLPAVSLVIALAAMSVTEIDQDDWPSAWKARARRALSELRPAFIVLGAGLAMSSLVLIVASIDWNGFWHAQSMQATIRLVSPDALGQFIYDPAINHNRVGRAFLVFLWMATFVALFNAPRRIKTTLTIPLVVYTITLALPAGIWHYGWYFLPLFPLLCIGAGIMLRDLFAKPGLLGGLLVVGLLTLYAVQLTIEPEWFMRQENWKLSRRITWGIALGVLAPVGAAQVFRHVFFRRLAQVALAASLVIYVGASARFILLYDETSRDVYDYDWGKPGTPVPGGRRDPLDGAFEIPVDAPEPHFTLPPR